jgi:membrane protein YqaA with SNARE-associated domain
MLFDCASAAVATPGQVNYQLVDFMSLVHVGVGAALALFRIGLVATLIIAVGWELVEHVLKNCQPQMFVFPSQDTLMNACGDVLCAVVGWLLGRWVSARSGRARERRRGRSGRGATPGTPSAPSPPAPAL